MKTAEAVSPKHPDKLCDQISDAILDACLEQDPMSRVAIECLGGHGEIKVSGELTTHADVDVEKIIKRIAGEGYLIQQKIVSQSPEISQGVDAGGAGDQGVMVGYACNDNEAMIPQELYLARSLCKYLYEYFPTDGKTQVTLNNGNIETIVASFQNVPQIFLKERVEEWLLKNEIYHSVIIFANPAGDWIQGGFEADTGVTGRKLMVDNYGPQISIGGGAFSGKDASKVDRSGAYMARKMAVSYLRALRAKEVIVKLAYAIGVAEPVMVSICVDGKEHLGLKEDWDLTPKGIMEFLDLRKPQFERLAANGHFGTGNLWDQ